MSVKLTKAILHLQAFGQVTLIGPEEYIDLSDYKAPEEEVDAVYLCWEEISLIYFITLIYPSTNRWKNTGIFWCSDASPGSGLVIIQILSRTR